MANKSQKANKTSGTKESATLAAARPEGDGLAILGKPKVLGTSVEATSHGDDGRFGPADNNEIFKHRYDQYRHRPGNDGIPYENRGPHSPVLNRSGRRVRKGTIAVV